MPVTPLGFAAKNARGAIFMSGTGANAETILTRLQSNDSPPWHCACIVTDRPKTSRSQQLAESFGLPLVALDIREFYREHGLKSQSLATEEGWRVRRLWTAALRQRLAPYNIDFGILAGFLALSNITADFPCLNVHPGDLTYERNDQRYLVGHHVIPIERAILQGLPSLRTSIIVAQPISNQDDMDSGPILGLSPHVPIDLGRHTTESLQAIAQERPAKRPKGGWKDPLENLANDHLSKLKTFGDLVAFPPVIDAFVAGHYGLDRETLYWRNDPNAVDWLPIKTVFYDPSGQPTPNCI